MKVTKIFLLFLVLIVFLSYSINGVSAELTPVYQDIGKISISVDAEGNNDANGGTIQVDKPEGATVKDAFLLASSYSGRVIENGDITLNNESVNWGITETNSLGSSNENWFYSVYADVTDIVKTTIDNAPAGILDINVVEDNTETIDGTILFVVFDDPNVTEDQTIILLFGAQSTEGDTFLVDFTQPLDGSTEQIDMGLGIGYSYQSTSGTNQVNIIDVNDMRLTSSAGGEDDGGSYNGALITVGGIGDSNDNPDPNAPSDGYDTDDELYSLLPYINTGDKQIKVYSQNPSDDDNIFFSYFFLSEPAAMLPIVEKPKKRELIGNLDPNLPTIVITHGLQKEDEELENLWTGTNETQAVGLLEDSLGDEAEKVNIVQYIWGEAFTPHGATWFDNLPDKDAYVQAQVNTPEAGARLALIIRDSLGLDYDKPIHFIGHSLGTAVNAHAAHHVTETLEGITKVQFTALDRPHHVSKIAWMSDDDEEQFGFDETFFASLLPMDKEGLDLRVDNYFALNGAGVGDRAEGNRVYNHAELIEPHEIDDTILGDEGTDNNHSGVHQWYRWTMRPNDPFPNGATVCNGAEFADNRQPDGFDNTLNPCEKGWEWSVNNQKILSGENEWLWPEEGFNGRTVNVTTPETLVMENVESFGCDYNGDDSTTIITCTEQSSPYLVADVNIPEDSQYLSFDYRFTNVGDGDYASIMIDNVPVWVMSGQSALSNDFVNSSKIPIKGFVGERKLMVALFGVNEKNAEFEVKNISTHKAEIVLDDTPPTTSSIVSGTRLLGDIYISNVEVALTAEDNPDGTGVAKTEYSLDSGETWNDYTEPYIFHKIGDYTFMYRSEDNAGNVEDAKTLSFKVIKATGIDEFVENGLQKIWQDDSKVERVKNATRFIFQKLPRDITNHEEETSPVKETEDEEIIKESVQDIFDRRLKMRLERLE